MSQPDKHARLKELIERHNTLVSQWEGLQGRADKLDAKIAAIRGEIDAEARRVSGPC